MNVQDAIPIHFKLYDYHYKKQSNETGLDGIYSVFNQHKAPGILTSKKTYGYFELTKPTLQMTGKGKIGIIAKAEKKTVIIVYFRWDADPNRDDKQKLVEYKDDTGSSPLRCCNCYGCNAILFENEQISVTHMSFIRREDEQSMVTETFIRNIFPPTQTWKRLDNLRKAVVSNLEFILKKINQPPDRPNKLVDNDPSSHSDNETTPFVSPPPYQDDMSKGESNLLK